MKKCSVDEMANAILEELQNYQNVVTEDLKKEVKDVSKICLKEIKSNSPTKSGKYKKGWKSKIESETSNSINVTIHNKDRYSIAHLLENGHKKSNGKGSVDGIPHIKSAEEHASELLEKKVRTLVRK